MMKSEKASAITSLRKGLPRSSGLNSPIPIRNSLSGKITRIRTNLSDLNDLQGISVASELTRPISESPSTRQILPPKEMSGPNGIGELGDSNK